MECLTCTISCTPCHNSREKILWLFPFSRWEYRTIESTSSHGEWRSQEWRQALLGSYHRCTLPPHGWHPLSLQIGILQNFQAPSPLKFPVEQVWESPCTKRPLTLAEALRGPVPLHTCLAQLPLQARTMPWWTWKLSCQQDLYLGGRLAGASLQDSPEAATFIHSVDVFSSGTETEMS